MADAATGRRLGARRGNGYGPSGCAIGGVRGPPVRAAAPIVDTTAITSGRSTSGAPAATASTINAGATATAAATNTRNSISSSSTADAAATPRSRPLSR